MPSFFSVIQYVPNVAAGEAVNVGVLVADETRVLVRPLDDWHRVRPFLGDQAKHVKRLVEDIQESPAAFLGIDSAASSEVLRTCLSRWTHSLRFSDVRASLQSADALLRSVAPVVLVENTRELTLDRRRTQVVRALYSAVSAALVRRFDRKPRGVLRKDARMQGRRTWHQADVGLVNGQVYAAAFALSFASRQLDKQLKDTDAVAFAVDDTAALRDGAEIAVLLDGPPEPTEPLERAQRLFGDMGVRTLSFGEITDWATEAVQRVPDDALAH